MAIAAATTIAPDDNLTGAEPLEQSTWKKRIKRLKLADPESSEEMLAHAATVIPEIVRG